MRYSDWLGARLAWPFRWIADAHAGGARFGDVHAVVVDHGNLPVAVRRE